MDTDDVSTNLKVFNRKSAAGSSDRSNLEVERLKVAHKARIKSFKATPRYYTQIGSCTFNMLDRSSARFMKECLVALSGGFLDVLCIQVAKTMLVRCCIVLMILVR